MRCTLAVLVTGLLAVQAAAQPWYARGTFGTPSPPPGDPGGALSEWNDLSYQMIEDPMDSTHYTSTVGGFFSGLNFEYKLAEEDFDPSYPSSNAKVTTNGDGEINFHLWTNDFQPWNDGWSPNGPRAGYEDSQQYDWEAVGSFNEWPGTGDTEYYMTDLGNGLHEGTFTIPTAGNHQLKFRQQGSWDTSIGLDFGNDDNIPLRTWDPNETVTFRLDLPNGRYQVVPTLPTPDLNNDEYVDAKDYVLWRKGNGSQAQYDRWAAHFGAPPPPDTSAFYARASWNPSFDDLSDVLVNNGGGLFTHTETGLTPGTFYEFKAANNNYSIEAPPQGNVKAPADADGEISLRFYFNNAWTDGWMPNNQYRIGYEDPGLYGWELMGEFNGWGGGPQYVMTNEGAGLYSVVVTGLVASTNTDGDGNFNEFKFRRHDGTTGFWDVNIGATFRHDGADAVAGAIAGDYKFELDLFNGRWRFTPVGGGGGAVPEPGSLVLALMLGLVACGMGRRR